MKMALLPRRGICFALALIFSITCLSPVDARQRFSTIQGNIREEAEIEPYEGGKKAGPAHDWELLCKIEGDEELKASILKKAEEGSLDHVFILGCMNLHGKGVPKNQPAAFELFRAASMKGHSNSQNNLGFMFEEGIGTKKDLKQALTWYQKAADYNNPSALCNLGNMYEHGRGVPVNADTALSLYQKASDLGNKTARHNVIGIEFERDRKWKLKGIEVSQNAPEATAPAKKGGVAQPAAPQRQTLTYNPTTALFRNEGQPAAKPAEVKTESQPAATAQAAPKAPVAAATKPTAPPAVAKADAKVASPSDIVSNVINKLKADKVAADKVAAAAAAKAAATPAKPNDKNAKLATAPKEKAAEKKAPEVAANPAPEEVKAEEKPAGLQAGTPTLTAILNRLSKGTSMEQADKPAAVAEHPAAVPAQKVEEAKPVVAAVPAKEEKKEAKKEEKKAEPKPAKVAEAKKPAEAKKTEDTQPVLLTSLLTANAPSAEKKAAEKPVAVKKEEKPAAPVVAKVEPKAEVKAEAKPEAKKSGLDSPVVYKAPAKPEVKPATPAKPESKPATAVASKPPAATTVSAEKAKEFKQLAEKMGGNRPIRDKWALVIGITDFQDPDIPDLQFSAKDATDFYNYLVKEANFQPDHVRLLLNEQATQRRVLSELGSKFLARVVKPDDLVVLYFSTHGSPSQLDPRGKNYLVASDSDSDDLFATGIEMQKLLDSIQGRVLTDRVLLVMDACHSGFAAPDSKGMSRLGNFKAEDLAQGSGQLVICSSMPEERAWESARYQNGVFTRKLLEGLRKKGTATSLVDAFTFTRDQVCNEVQEDRPGAKQTPVLKGKWDGNDLVLATPAYAPQMVPNSVSQSLSTDSRVDLIASASRPSVGARSLEPSDSDVAKPSNGSAPRSGVLYLDSQFFSINGDPKKLAKEYHDAIRTNPSDADLYFLRAKALIQMEDWHNAMTCLSDAIQMSPNRAQYYLGRAYVNFRLGKSVLAEQDLDQAKFYDRKLTGVIKFHM